MNQFIVDTSLCTRCGLCVADCPSFIIELDGSQHLEQEEYDEERTRYLESLGYRVIRFWNNDVTKNVDGVILAIMQAMEDKTNS